MQQMQQPSFMFNYNCYIQFKMNSLFLDTFNTLASQLESNAIHILSHSRKISEKIQNFNLQLAQFKCGVLNMLQGFIQQQRTAGPSVGSKNARILEDVQNEINVHKDKLTRLRLHQILKRKLQKQKKQSMLGSSILTENQSMMNLEKSVVMIQKDLGIQNEPDGLTQRLGLSTVISRSLLGQTPSRLDKSKDCSIMSQVDSLPCIDSSIDVQKVEMPPSPQNVSKQNVVDNYKKSRMQQEPKISEQKQAKKVASSVKKTKKTVFSKVDSAKQGLLDNLLEQSFNICHDKK